MSRLAPRSPEWLIQLWMTALLGTFSALSDAECLALLMTPDPGLSLDRPQEILLLAGGLSGLASLDGEALFHVGLDPWDAASILAAVEMSRRLVGTPVSLPLE